MTVSPLRIPRNAREETPYYEPTDLGNAKRLVDSHGSDLRYAPELATWLVWDGRRWAEDVTGESERQAKAVSEEILNEGRRKADEKLFRHGLKAQSAAGIRNMLSLAATEPGVPVRISELDFDPWAFSALNGTVDLRSGDLRRHNRADLATKLAPVDYDRDARAPVWDKFLAEVFHNDTDLIGFVQRLAGYSLTGDVSEQVMPFCYGTGANGKSTFLNALRGVVGDYGLQLNPVVLLASAHEQHPTGLTDLRGARFVATIETEAGQRLNEALVKQLTGGDRIRARRMHRDFYEFAPTHKLWHCGNHLPRIDGTDTGIWRRLALVPFTASFVDRPDKTLPDKLAAEGPGILAWAVRGCLDWRASGLRIPAVVRAATSEYRETQDHVGRFLADACVVGEHASVSAKALRSDYEAWCAEQGERPWTAQALGRELSLRGLDRSRVGAGKVNTWIGLGLQERAS